MACKRNYSLLNLKHFHCWPYWMNTAFILIISWSALLDPAFAQGRSGNRRWSIRKTGEFGRRLTGAAATVDNVQSSSSLSQELELPTRQFRLSAAAAARRGHGNLDAVETRQYSNAAAADVANSQFFRGAGASPSGLEIRKPSLDLELPRFGGYQNFVADQEAEETEDSEGYAYPRPEQDSADTDNDSSNGGYDYSAPMPGVKPNEPADDSTTTPPEPPNSVEPDVVPGGQVYSFSPNKVETDEEIDAAGLHNKKSPAPSSPQVQGVPKDDHAACSGSDDDPACWPHGYSGVIPGEAGTDYPILAEIVQTGFSCDEQQYSGYYADTDPQARCQIFHVCLKRNRHRKTQQWSFLCPNGTVFSQPDFVCVWWGDAPDCSDTVVRSLYNLNEQLGWDNVTEGGGLKQGGSSAARAAGELQSAMTAFSATRAAAAATGSTRQSSSLPYRVPVKVPAEGTSGRARTKLQEVTQNALHGQSHDLDYGEHDGEESSNFETSLRKQQSIESRSKTKTSSALHKSVSEGYELKGSADGVQPFIVNRPPPPSAPTDQPQYENQDVVMMPTLQRFPDGSEGYAEVPVMLPHHPTHNPDQAGYDDNQEGYQYPTPTSTPAPTYLPPRRSTTPPSTTTEYFPPPTIPTEPPIPDQENYEQQSGDRITTTEQPEEGYHYPQPTTTESQPEEDSGYNYPDPSHSAQQQVAPSDTADDEQGYRYPQPTTTTATELQPVDPQEVEEDVDSQGYRYPNPSTTQRSSRFRETTNPTTTEPIPEESTSEQPPEEGYNYQVPTAGSQFESLRETTTEQESGYNYQRPSTTTENYNEQISTQQSTNFVEDSGSTTTTSRIEATTTEVQLPAGGYLPPNDNQLTKDSTGTTSEETDYEEDEEANEVVTDSSSGISGAEDESGYSYHLPTPPVSSPSSSMNDIVLNGGALDSDDKLNEILKQIQTGGIEAVDSNGKPIEFSKLKQLLLNSPRGSVELKGELDSATSSSTEVSTTPLSGGPSAPGGGRQQVQTQQPFYHTVTTAAVLPNNPENRQIFNTNSHPSPPATTTSGGPIPPTGFYLPPNNNAPINNNQPAHPQQQQYYNNNNNNNNEIVQYVDHPSFEIKLPSREFESHSEVNLNSIAAAELNNQNRPFSQQQPQPGYYQQQPQQQQHSPQQQFFQQQSPPPGNYLPPPPPQPQPQVQVLQPQVDYERSNALNNLVLPQQQQQQQQQQLPQNPPNGEYLPPRQATSSILQPQYYQQSPSSPSSSAYVSPPIQLTENIQLQQSFALPAQQPLLPTNSRNNPLVDPKDIKIVPALFVHQHTSVDAQDNQIRGSTSGVGKVQEAFQTLDTAQSNYYPSASSSLAQQLNQLANLVPQSSAYSTSPRQFFRRSNSNNNNSGGGSSSSGSSSSTHTIEKAHQVSTFTLEDARTPDELQKYHHQDLKRFHSENIAKQGGVLDDVVPPTPTHSTVPVVSSIVRQQPHQQQRQQPQQPSSSSSSNRGGRREGGGSASSGGPNRFSVSTNTNDDSSRIITSNRDAPSSHRNEEYFIPVSGSYGGGGGGGSGSSSGSIVRSSSSNSNNNNSDNFSQFRVNGRSSSSRNGGGSGRSSGSGSSYQFVESERALLETFLPEQEGGFGSRLLS